MSCSCGFHATTHTESPISPSLLLGLGWICPAQIILRYVLDFTGFGLNRITSRVFRCICVFTTNLRIAQDFYYHCCAIALLFEPKGIAHVKLL